MSENVFAVQEGDMVVVDLIAHQTSQEGAVLVVNEAGLVIETYEEIVRIPYHAIVTVRTPIPVKETPK